MPRKEFESFTRLDASDVNTFLMDQSVMTFGSATARDAAIDTPVEGQVTYLTDIDSLTVYNGTQWVTNRPVMNFAGTAARGSAIPSPVEGMVSYLEDANVLSVYDGSNWKTSLATTGSVLQVVQATRTGEVATTSGTFVTANLEVAITPKSTNSKILVLVDGDCATGATNRQMFLTVFRGGTGGTNLAATSFGRARADSGGIGAFVNISFLDTPNTTSSTTYSVMFRADGGFVGVFSTFGSITLLEIAG